MENNSGLKIFKASAGSGKTFLLVESYLKMLFANPLSYRNILAVTFTNKATAEMKERILKELANLAAGRDSGYSESLKEFGNAQKIKMQASFILKKILHDYSRFSIMTIDSFFQKIIRSFAREIRLNASFKTEIDNRQALEDAVDRLFQEVDSNDLLMDWMMQFLEENLEEGISWDFRKELVKFGREVEKEAFKVHGDEFLDTLTGKEKLSGYISEVKQAGSKAEMLLRSLGQQGLDLMANAGISYDQFKAGRNSFANLFNKMASGKFDLPNKTAQEACDNLENWFKKTDTPQFKRQAEELYYNGLNSLLKESIEALNHQLRILNSCQAILKNIYPFGLLGNIALKIKEVLGEKNTVLLSDSGRMIGRIIDGNDTPFIYERVGLIYRYFMLDEFQDTSRQQWENFKPLIENSLASGFPSLVVGDVKQSIYRWRSGDWNLLANQLAEDLRHQNITVRNLEKNWRSGKSILDFNNSLYRFASKYLDDYIKSETLEPDFSAFHGVISSAYEGHYQENARVGSAEGVVELRFVEPEGAANKGAFREKALELLLEELERVQVAGVKAEDIAILVRENSEAGLIANALWERKKRAAVPGCIYDVLTSDTLKIGQSIVVGYVINFMRFLLRRDSKQLRGELLYAYYRILQPLMTKNEQDAPTDLHDLFDSGMPLPELFREWLDENPQSDFQSGLLALPLYELAVSVIEHFSLGKVTGEKVYLQAFLDMVLEYGREESGGIPGFLSWWEVSGSNKTLNLSNVKNFIRISSIHQSKGLEYHTLFIPFCHWEIGLNARKPNYIWAFPGTEPFNGLSMVLLKCDPLLKNSIFTYDYYHELLYSIMDNLNLLYVATTRAIHNLYLILPYKEDKQKSSSVAELIQGLVERSNPDDSIDRQKFRDMGECWDPVRKYFKMGAMVTSVQDPKTEIEVQKSDEPLLLTPNNRMKIRLHSKDYFQLSGDDKNERVNQGTMMHQLFEKIKSRKDVGGAVAQMVADGFLTATEGEYFFGKIDRVLQELPYSDWFSDQWKVLNERDILRIGASRHRPDRVLLQGNRAVVVDYKTGEESAKDIRQMKGYLQDLQKMGYLSCEGNLWYLNKGIVVKVEAND
jgi:ATP-dependent exoDNAse (exonuclease V) beta subunit